MEMHLRAAQLLRPEVQYRTAQLRPCFALNEETEVADLLVAYGVLRHGTIADVTVVAERAEPIRLYPGSLSVEPQTTARAFDERYPDGADHVVVPAMESRNDQFARDWIVAQYRKGAKIVSICNGSKTLAAAGLLDGRRATGHWYTMPRLLKDHPSLLWVQDRRYVSDDGITTSTGVTSNVLVMMALVEAISGRETAKRVAGDLGIANWDARHRSTDFQLTSEHKKTFVRNKLAFWRHDTIGLSVAGNVDEIALGLTVDDWSRTEKATVIAVGKNGDAICSRHGLLIRPDRPIESAAVVAMLSAPSSDAPAMTMERELARIAACYDVPTASLVALVMEYPWAADNAKISHQ